MGNRNFDAQGFTSRTFASATSIKRFLLGAALIAGAAVACGSEKPEDEQLGRLSQQLTSNERILDFENVGGASNDWTATVGQISSSTNVTHGASALAIANGGNTEINSASLTSLGQNINAALTLDLFQPSNHPNPSWHGTITPVLISESLQLWWEPLQTIDLNSHPLGQYLHLSFPLSQSIRDKLKGTYNDLKIKLLLNVNNGAGPWLIDNIVISADQGSSGGAGGSGGAGSGAGGSGGAAGSSGASGNAGTGGSAGTAGQGGTGGLTTSGPCQFSTQSSTAETKGFFFQLPASVDRNDIAVTGASIIPNDRVKILDGAGGFSSIASIGAGGINLGASAELQSIWTQAPALLRSNARVHGFVRTSGSNNVSLQAGATVDGGIFENQNFEPVQTISWPVLFPGSRFSGCIVEPNAVQTLAPGSYGDVTVRGRLRLGPGLHTFESLGFDSGSVWEIENPASVQVYVRNAFFMRGVELLSHGGNTNVVVGVASLNPVTVGSSAHGFQGHIVTPWTGLTLESSVTGSYIGSFHGSSVTIHQDATVVREDLCVPGIGGECRKVGDDCNSDFDCAAGLSCGVNNGGCYGKQRARRVCWSPVCEDGITPDECGTPESVCGQNCGCVNPCDPTNPSCPPGEVCKPGLGPLFNSPSRDVCVNEPECPTDDPALCGDVFALCGPHCICTPNCASATCANPGDGCGGECPNVCDDGETGGTDVHCTPGSACILNADGTCTCRPEICNFSVLTPPLCGTPGAICGEQCPVCTPECDGRQCGLDPKCGASCGTCSGGASCDANGQCATPTSDPPMTVPDGQGGQRPINDLPSPPATPIGALKGQFSVSEMGAAQYTVPIEVPPGRAAMEPALSLVYRGSRENTDLGVGWVLEGLTKITRCPRTFAMDGFSAPVKNDTSDLFCVDGKRLERVSGTGTYGANGTQYRTLIDSFSKVVSYVDSGDGFQLDPIAGVDRVARDEQGPDYFRIWTKDGRILTFGKTRDSLVMGRDGVRYAWLLNRIEDRVGNNVLVSYFNVSPSVPGYLKHGFPNIVRPSVISYTGHGNTAGNREVRFDYESRNDFQLKFLQGGVTSLSIGRLSRITTLVKGAAVKNYKLDYKANDLSQIEKISECAGADDGLCKPPTRFTYTEESGFTFSDNGGPVMPSAGQLDANGDGIADFLETTVTVNGVDASPTLQAATIATDIGVAVGTGFLTFGTGLAVTALYTYVKPIFWGLLAEDPTVHFSQDLRLGTGLRSGNVAMIVSPTGVRCPVSPANFLDYDRDGNDDVISDCFSSGSLFVSRSGGDGHFQNFPSNGASVANVPIGRIQLTPIASTQPSSLPGPAPIIFDIDGDSLQDIVSCKDVLTLELRRRLAPTQNFETTPIQHISLPIFKDPLCSQSKPTHNIFDIDGDGTPDLLVKQPRIEFNGVEIQGGDWKVLRYSRVNGQPMLNWETVDFPDVGESALGRGMTLGDFNGDGLIDIWTLLTGGLKGVIWLNTGNNQFSARTLVRPLVATSPFVRHATTATVDYNADGRSDLVEHWMDPRTDPSQNVNGVLIADPHVIFWTKHLPQDLEWPIIGGGTAPGQFFKAADVDGDGNVDLFGTFGRTFYGSGKKNTLLTRVEDGLGNVISVSYDAPGTYKKDEQCAGSTWPETCMKRMVGLVSGHSEGFVNAEGQPVVERSYEYKYFNGRMNVTGHGWLGFDKRTVTQLGELDDPGTTVTTEFEPPVRYDIFGQPTPSTHWPYLYPLAGMVKRVTIDDNAPGFLGDPGPLETAQYDRRTQVENDWTVHMSAFGRPFPYIQTRMTSTFDRERPPVLGDDTRPFEDNGLLRTVCEDSFTPDGYGNTVTHVEKCQVQQLDQRAAVEVNEVSTSFTPNPDTWLISNPEFITVKSTRSENVRVQEWDPVYDSQGLLQVMTRGPNSDGRHRTNYQRDQFGNVQHIIEDVNTGEAPRVTFIDYDSDDIFPLRIINPEGHISQVRFDARWGAPKTMADANGIAVQHAYDTLGLRTETRDSQGTTTYAYVQGAATVETEAGSIHPRIELAIERVGTDGSRAGRTLQRYDYLGRPVWSISEGFGGAGIIQEQAYDRLGRLLGSTLPHTADVQFPPAISYTYDHLDRVTQIRQPDGSVAERQYASGVTLAPQFSQWLAGILCPDANDDFDLTLSLCTVGVEREIDEEGHQNVLITDHRGLPVRSIDGRNTVTTSETTKYTYGAFNRLIETRDNRNLRTAFDYDPYGRFLSHTDPDSGTTSYVYSGYDDLKRSTDAAGQIRLYQRDMLGRLTSVIDPAGTTQWIYDQGINAIGRLAETISPATAENPGGQRMRYTYEAPTPTNNRGLLQKLDYIIDGTIYPVSMAYDDLGRTERVDYPDLGTGNPIAAKYLYDNSGVLTGVDEVGSGEDKPLWRMNEAFQGHLLQRETFGNGASTTFGYNSDRRWLDSIHTTLGANPIQTIDYTHYDNGQVNRRTTPTSARQHFYESLGRLSAVIDPTTTALINQYDYDAIGNVIYRGNTPVTYRDDRPHLVHHVGQNSYQHDANGNVTSRSGPDIPGGIQTFEWTPFDLPKKILTGQAGVVKTTKFEYSAYEERLVRRDDNVTRHFVTDLYQRLVDNASSDTLEERFLLYTGDRQLGEIVRSNGADRTLYFHADHLGSPDTISDHTGGTFHQDFNDFGRPIDPPNPAVTRSGFTGHQHDDDLGLIDMRGRIYDPLAAQFTSADPVTQAPFWSQGLNRYAYAFNDPVNVTDPTGFFALDMGSGPAASYATACEGCTLGSAGLNLGVGGTLLAAGTNVGTTLGMAALGVGSRPGGTFTPAPSAAPNSSGVGQTSTSAVDQAAPIRSLVSDNPYTVDPVEFDPRTERNLKTLHPTAEKRIRAFLEDIVDAGYDVTVTDGYVDYATQAKKYQAGRASNGQRIPVQDVTLLRGNRARWKSGYQPVRTNALPGRSYHGMGAAVDADVRVDGKPLSQLPKDREAWRRIEAIAKRHGLEWGGNFKPNYDPVHFQYTGGISIDTMIQRYKDGLDVYTGMGSQWRAPWGSPLPP